jgi:hypothetical protein
MNYLWVPGNSGAIIPNPPQRLRAAGDFTEIPPQNLRRPGDFNEIHNKVMSPGNGNGIPHKRQLFFCFCYGEEILCENTELYGYRFALQKHILYSISLCTYSDEATLS